MFSTIFKGPLLFLLGGCLMATSSSFAQNNTGLPLADESIKSYFLLKLNLETDPVDLQNYFDALDFKQDFRAFAEGYAVRASLNAEESQVLKWAIADGLNGDLDQSLKKLHRVVVMSPIQSDQDLLASVYLLMSRIMELKGDYSRAVSYLEQAMLTAKTAGNSRMMALIYQHRGRVWSLQENAEQAETDLLKNALPAFSRLKNQAAIADCYREIANHYLRREMYTQSNWFYLQSLQTAQKANYAPGIIQALTAIGQYKYDIQAYTEACQDWLEAEQVAIRSHQLPLLLKLKFELSRACSKLGKKDLSARYALEFEQLRDILLNPVL
jgi:tetratricopeptide (TPR) repeat protein